MKSITVVVPWEEGLHMRPAALLVKRAQAHSATVLLRLGGKVADARSILSIMLLAATLGSVIQVDVNGVDEDSAAQAIEQVFEETEQDED